MDRNARHFIPSGGAIALLLLAAHGVVSANGDVPVPETDLVITVSGIAIITCAALMLIGGSRHR